MRRVTEVKSGDDRQREKGFRSEFFRNPSRLNRGRGEEGSYGPDHFPYRELDRDVGFGARCQVLFCLRLVFNPAIKKDRPEKSY